MRGREFEKKISPLYLEQLSLDYEQLMMQFEKKHPKSQFSVLTGMKWILSKMKMI